MRTFVLSIVCVGVLLAMLPARAAADDPPRRISVSIDVRGLPDDAVFVTVSCPVDFTALLSRLSINGAVDTHTLRFYRVTSGGEAEVPVQFSPSSQPRPKERQLLPGTPPTVSLVGEYDAGKTPPVSQGGELAWAAVGGGSAHRYRLDFSVPRGGRFVQVPYPPQDLKAFDAAGRATEPHNFPVMQVRPQRPMDGMVHLYEGKQLVTSYHVGPAPSAEDPEIRRPFFHPVNGPDGIGLTEFGKPHDPTLSHAHHYSLWVAHPSVNDKSFWGERAGVIINEQLELQEDGPVFCRLVQKTRWVQDGKDVLRERRTMTLHRTPEDFRLIDIELELTPAGKEPVTLGKTTFGFLAARVAQSMTVFDGGGEIVNAAGDLNEHGAHLKRAAWIDQSGPVAPGKWGGLAILDHPSNPNHPTAWHCRNDGWAGAAFNKDEPRTIQPGESLKLRYRVHLHRGNAKDGSVARRFTEYSARPEIRVGAPQAP